MKKIIRNTSTAENARFWQSAIKSAEIVDRWPAWKKGWVRTAHAQPPSSATGATAQTVKTAQEG